MTMTPWKNLAKQRKNKEKTLIKKTKISYLYLQTIQCIIIKAF